MTYASRNGVKYIKVSVIKIIVSTDKNNQIDD